MKKVSKLVLAAAAASAFAVLASTASAIRPPGTNPGPSSPFDDTTLFAPDPALPGGFDESNGDLMRGASDNGRGGISFVNDPCLDPPPTAPEPERRRRTVQSETDLAVLNTAGSMGKKIVVGYNDSWGFYNNRQGLSGFAYSVNGGNTFIDGGGLPPKVPSGTPNAVIAGFPPPSPVADGYFGDPVVAVHHKTGTFYFSSIYKSTNQYFTISVNRGRFVDAPPQNAFEPESVSNTRCKNGAPTEFGVPDPPSNVKERIIWEPPMEIVKPPNLGTGSQDFLDKEWLYVDQKSGTLYVTYTRFSSDGSTPIELVKCPGCAFKANPTDADWVGPFVIVPNEALDFNQATQPVTTNTGRVLVTWIMRRFAGTGGVESENRIEYAISDNDGVTFGPEQTVAVVNPQREPLGYNRARRTILNAPYITADKGEDDGVTSKQESDRAGFNNVYITYFSGKTSLPILTSTRSEADIFVSTSTNNGTSFGPRVKVNDDPGTSTHIFPTVQANKHGDVYVGWTDRRNDPTNVLNERWAAVSHDLGLIFGHNVLQDDVQDSWFARADARPNFGDYDSSELLGFNQFVMTWSEGKFPPLGQAGPSTNPLLRQTTPDTVFTIANGLGLGGG